MASQDLSVNFLLDFIFQLVRWVKHILFIHPTDYDEIIRNYVSTQLAYLAWFHSFTKSFDVENTCARYRFEQNMLLNRWLPYFTVCKNQKKKNPQHSRFTRL